MGCGQIKRGRSGEQKGWGGVRIPGPFSFSSVLWSHSQEPTAKRCFSFTVLERECLGEATKDPHSGAEAACAEGATPATRRPASGACSKGHCPRKLPALQRARRGPGEHPPGSGLFKGERSARWKEKGEPRRNPENQKNLSNKINKNIKNADVPSAIYHSFGIGPLSKTQDPHLENGKNRRTYLLELLEHEHNSRVGEHA